MTMCRASGNQFALSLTLLCFLFSANTHADTFRVGVGTGCTHATLELALAEALANGPSYDQVDLAVPLIALAARSEILNNEVGLFGGFASCAAPLATARTTISFAGPDEVFWVHGTSGTQLNLTAVDVAPGPAGGRAITIEGFGEVFMEDATLSGGHAVEGGNVWIGGSDALLMLTQGSEITFGEATPGEGGGVYCESGADIVLESNSKITDNTAFGAGGGLFLNACNLSIDQPSTYAPPGTAEVSRNKAMTGSGGGIAAVGASFVHLAGWPAAGRPFHLSDNEAVLGGGGGAILNVPSGLGAMSLVAAQVTGNIAGGAGGGLLLLEGFLAMTSEPSYCPAGRGCSVLAANRSGSAGGGIFIQGGSFAEATITQTSIHGNYNLNASSGAAVAISGSSNVTIEGCEIYDNDPNGGSGVETPRIFATGSFSNLTVAFTTIVEETVGAGVAVFQNNNAFSMKLLSSIVQASKTFTSQPPATQVDCVIVRESASLPVTATAIAVVTDPTLLFRLSTPTDFSLLRESQAQDYCDTAVYTPTATDIDHQVRGFDDIPLNGLGPYDLGADEWHPELLADGFESGDTTHWSSMAP